MPSSNPSELLKAIEGAITCVETLQGLTALDDKTTAVILTNLVPTCNHPICWEAYRGVLKLVQFCNHVHKSPEFATLQKELIKAADNLKTMSNLHRYRN
jgi:hypothetical protein